MKRCLPLILSCLLFASCEKLLMPDDSPATATATFDYLWHQMDERYSMFDVKRVDWQAVYDSLRPKVYDGMKSDSLFTEDGRLTAAGLMENIAQTCAARMGYINQYIYKKKVQLGFIGSVRNLVVKRVPLLGETLTTTITVVEEIMKLTLVNAEIKVDDETIVTAEMKIALSEQEVLEPQLVTSINEGER